MSDTAPRSALSDRLTRVFGGLRHVIGEWWGQHRRDDALIHVVWVGLSIRLNRLTSLIARFEAGTLPTPRPRATPLVVPDSLESQPVTCRPSTCGPVACDPAACKPRLSEAGPGDAWAAAVAAVRLPRRKAWLLGKIQPTALYYWELRKLLDDPQMIALIAATPQAGRLLRPLWHMIAPHPLPEILRLPPRPRRPSRPATLADDAVADAVAMQGTPRPAGPAPALTESALAAASRLRRKRAGFARPRPERFLPA